jgi:hypothetical protein
MIDARWFLALPLLVAAQDGPTASDARIHPFILQALASPHAAKSNFFVSADGKIVRSSVHMKREGIPAWVHAMADEKLGIGEDVEYEVEVYPDGSEVYEVYRKIGGRQRQLSVKTDKTVYYIGTEHDRKSMPPSIAAALRKIDGFEMKECVAKEGATFFEYHVKGVMRGSPHRARLAKDGRLIALQRRIPSEVEVESSPPPGE